MFRTITPPTGYRLLTTGYRPIGFVWHVCPQGPRSAPPGRAELGSFGAMAPACRVGLAPPIPLRGCKLASFRTNLHLRDATKSPRAETRRRREGRSGTFFIFSQRPSVSARDIILVLIEVYIVRSVFLPLATSNLQLSAIGFVCTNLDHGDTESTERQGGEAGPIGFVCTKRALGPQAARDPVPAGSPNWLCLARAERDPADAGPACLLDTSNLQSGTRPKLALFRTISPPTGYRLPPLGFVCTTGPAEAGGT